MPSGNKRRSTGFDMIYGLFWLIIFLILNFFNYKLIDGVFNLWSFYKYWDSLDIPSPWGPTSARYWKFIFNCLRLHMNMYTYKYIYINAHTSIHLYTNTWTYLDIRYFLIPSSLKCLINQNLKSYGYKWMQI